MNLLVDYIKKMLGDSGLSETKASIVKMIYDENMDIRSLNNLKRHLLDSK
jgi:hypothetical protein